MPLACLKRANIEGMKCFVLLMFAATGLVGCAKINDVGMGMLSSSSLAVAVINDTLLTGKAVVYTDRTGTLNLESDTEPKLKCMGNIRYTASRSGSAVLKCSDGNEAAMQFNAMGETRGYGSGKSNRGTASFAFGLPLASAAAYLTLPAGKRIVTDAEGNSKIETL
jgi:hypothetical protein